MSHAPCEENCECCQRAYAEVLPMVYKLPLPALYSRIKKLANGEPPPKAKEKPQDASYAEAMEKLTTGAGLSRADAEAMLEGTKGTADERIAQGWGKSLRVK